MHQREVLVRTSIFMKNYNSTIFGLTYVIYTTYFRNAFKSSSKQNISKRSDKISFGKFGVALRSRLHINMNMKIIVFRAF